MRLKSLLLKPRKVLSFEKEQRSVSLCARAPVLLGRLWPGLLVVSAGGGEEFSQAEHKLLSAHSTAQAREHSARRSPSAHRPPLQS